MSAPKAGVGAGSDRAAAGDGPAAAGDDRAYLVGVMDEIDEEVRRRRASGDLPARVERELDELFLEHSPVAGQGGGLGEALRMVDAAAFIDPVVPVDSAKSGGAVVKKGLRTLSLWYMGYVTHQVSQFATAVSRSLHLLDERVGALQSQLDAQEVPPAPVVEAPGWHNPDAWWVADALAALQPAPGRVLHAAAGDGWLVRVLTAKGVDAYGVDPRPETVDRAELDGTDLREEGVLEHLRAVEPSALGGVVLTGVVDPMTNGERRQLLEVLVDRLAPEGTLVVHSLSPAGWDADDAPPASDLASGRPLRARAWANFLPLLGFTVTVHEGPTGADYLAVAVLREATSER
ncbi:MAG: class I SAM-dependent methyltransferase [Acidimicrobiales bacterium]